MRQKSKTPRLILKSALLISFIFLSSCAHVQINDAEVCGDMGPQGASCFHTLTDETRDIPKDGWDSERFGMVCTKAESFANWKAALLKLCKVSHSCTYEQKKLIQAFAKHMELLASKRGTME